MACAGFVHAKNLHGKEPWNKEKRNGYDRARATER